MDRPIATLFFAAVALALWGFGGRWALQSWELTRHGVVAEGRVGGLSTTTATRREGRRDNRRDVVETSTKPVIYYEAAGDTYHFTPIVNEQHSVPGVGGVVRVRYLREHPEDGVVDSFAELWLAPVVLGVVGLLAFLAALVAASPPSARSPYARDVPFAPAPAKTPRAPAAVRSNADARPKPRRGKRAVFHVPGDEPPPK